MLSFSTVPIVYFEEVNISGIAICNDKLYIFSSVSFHAGTCYNVA